MSEHWTIEEFFVFRENPGEIDSSTKAHLRQCRLCRELADVVDSTACLAQESQAAKSTSTHFTGNSAGELLASIYAGTLTGSEAGDFLSHLQACPQCFEHLSSVVNDSLQSVTYPGTNSLANRSGISLAEVVLKRVPPERAHSTPGLRRLATSMVGRTPVPAWTGRLAAGMLVLLVLSLAALFLLSDRSNPYWDTLVYDQNVPYDYFPETARGENEEVYSLRHRFEAAISAYQARDYDRASLTFAGLASAAESLLDNDPATAAELRDFYFFWGLCHFALFRSATRDFDVNQREAFLIDASRYLDMARSLAHAYDLSDPGREVYFLALIMVFSGKPDAAISELQEISPKSTVYTRSTETLRQLQRK